MDPESENPPESPSSGDDTKISSAPSPKKRKGMMKRVVSVPIGDVEGSKSRSEAHPPSDSWAWRKYGQKPIKGSPYPRGYYRCSTSKGCPARKHVERSRTDPTVLNVTYASDHNHPSPAAKHRSATSTSPISKPALPAELPPEELAVFDNQLVDESSPLLEDRFAWFADEASPTVLESPICGGGGSTDSGAAMVFGEEDESLFADLGELPECSLVFQRFGAGAVPCCGSTG